MQKIFTCVHVIGDGRLWRAPPFARERAIHAGPAPLVEGGVAMRTIRRCRAVLFLILLAATPLFAQEWCEPGDTIAQCHKRYKKDAGVEANAYVKEMEAQAREAF